MLNDIKVKAAKPKDKLYRVFDGQGMYLEIMPNGSKYWRLKYRIRGKERRLALGVYPNVSLKDARTKKDAARKLIAQDIDPFQEKKKNKTLSQQNADNTFEAIAREWHELNKSKWSERYAEGIMTRLEAYIFPEIGSYPITEIEPPILLQTIRKIEKRPAIEIAKRQLQKCGEVFRYAIACGKAVRDPSADIKGALSHPAYLTSAYILRGSRPDAVILQHAPGRINLSDYPEVPMPSATSEINLIETFSDTKVIGLTINHENMTDDEISAAILHYKSELNIPTTDALTRPSDCLVEMVLSAFPALEKKKATAA